MRVFVGLGSNLDEPDAQLRAARRALEQVQDTVLEEMSPVYRTAPMGPADQPDFLNAVAALRTDLDPFVLLDRLQDIETAHGRVRRQHWGPRTLDLDLLLYGESVLWHPRLQLPHPGLHQRGFVLYPLADIAPRFRVPGRGLVQDLLAGLAASEVRRVHDFCWSESL